MTHKDAELLMKAFNKVNWTNAVLDNVVNINFKELNEVTTYVIDTAKLKYISTACDQMRKEIDELQLVAVVMADRFEADFRNKNNPNAK